MMSGLGLGVGIKGHTGTYPRQGQTRLALVTYAACTRNGYDVLDAGKVLCQCGAD
jgi:hypothetical protein